MKNLKKLFLMLGLLLGIFACSSLPTEEDSSSSVKSSVKFTMENIVNSANSNILFSSTDEQTPNKVAISYKKSGEGEEVISTTIELTAFGNSYITDDVLSLYEGNYELTKFDVLNDEGTTIYSTPKSGSEKAKDLNITTALAYGFEVKEGKISKVDMQVVEVSDTTDPADFGHAAFTFDKVDFSKFYIEVLVLDDSLGWVYTTAQINVLNSENTNIKTANIDGKMNKVIVANSDSYKITISKDGYASQELSFSKAKLEAYESKAMVVKLKKSTISTEGLVAYYPFNGNANDESGTGNNGTINGNITFSENGAYFDGSSYISVPSNSTLNPEKELTIAFWAKPIKFENFWGTLIFKGGGARSGWNNREYSVWINKNNIYYMASAGNNSNEIIMYANYEVLNNWVFYVGLIDRVNHVMKIYLNNELVSTISDSYSSFNNNDNDLCIGHCEENIDAHANYNGYLDEIRIYKRVLSEEEITELFNKGH